MLPKEPHLPRAWIPKSALQEPGHCLTTCFTFHLKCRWRRCLRYKQTVLKHPLVSPQRASRYLIKVLHAAKRATSAKSVSCVAVCCRVLQGVAVCCNVLQCVAGCCSALQCVAVCCSVLQCVVVCCSALQCVAVCCSFGRKSHVYLKCESPKAPCESSDTAIQQLHYTYSLPTCTHKEHLCCSLAYLYINVYTYMYL